MQVISRRGNGFTRTIFARQNLRGFTLMELLIVIAILALVILAFVLTSWRGQVMRGFDTKRKADLTRLRVSFEEYNNDHNCYPAVDVLVQCGGPALQPYQEKVPCDPQTKLPYKYIPIDTNNLCKGYRILTTLSDPADPDIIRVGCSPTQGCGFGIAYNWGVSAGTQVPYDASSDSVGGGGAGAGGGGGGGGGGATPTPGGAGEPTKFACAPGGFCNVYADPPLNGCPVFYMDNKCSNECNNASNWCLK